MDNKKPPPRPAASYALLYPHFCEAVRPLGYALTLHGSMNTDMDLVAVPWVDNAAEPEDVVKAIRDRISGFGGWDSDPGKLMPHGRRGWLIWFKDIELPFGGRCHIDLSIIPKIKKNKTTKETIEKVLNRPGICTQNELRDCKEFISNLQENLKIYISSAGHEPIGFTLDSQLDRIEEYLKRKADLGNTDSRL
jgi:hypothetical protein